MKILTNITEEREVEISLPMFKKEKRTFDNQSHNYFAVLPDETIIDVFISGKYTFIKHCPAKYSMNDILNRQKWDDITEHEFLVAHSAALKSMSLEPQLSETDPDDLKNISL